MQHSVDRRALVAMIISSVEPVYARDHGDITPFKVLLNLRGEQFEALSAMSAIPHCSEQTVTLSAADRVRFIRTFGEIGMKRWDERKFARTARFIVPMELFYDASVVDRDAPYTEQDREAQNNTRGIFGFATIYAFKHGTLWYIIDNTGNVGCPFRDSVGGAFGTYTAACAYAEENYRGDYA